MQSLWCIQDHKLYKSNIYENPRIEYYFIISLLFLAGKCQLIFNTQKTLSIHPCKYDTCTVRMIVQ